MLFLYPLTAPRIVGTDMLHAAVLLWVAGAGHLLHGNVDLHAMAWLLVGSIPGVLVGSQLRSGSPSARSGSCSRSCSSSPGIKLVKVPAADTIVEVGAALGVAALIVWSTQVAAAAAPARRKAPRRISRAWPGCCSTAFFFALLAATAGAFALTERAKLERSPIYGTRITPIFSPDGKVKPVAQHRLPDSAARAHRRLDGGRARAQGDRRSRRIEASLRMPPSASSGTGSPPRASSVPDGVYRPVVKLIDSHRTITLPSTIGSTRRRRRSW